MTPAHADSLFDECIDACEEALHACQACAAYDIRDASPGMAQCSLINLDCADACAATLNALARHSDHHGDFCALCSHLCRVCSEECGKHDHQHCRKCKEACDRCAAACAKHASEKHAA